MKPPNNPDGCVRLNNGVLQKRGQTPQILGKAGSDPANSTPTHWLSFGSRKLALANGHLCRSIHHLRSRLTTSDNYYVPQTTLSKPLIRPRVASPQPSGLILGGNSIENVSKPSSESSATLVMSRHHVGTAELLLLGKILSARSAEAETRLANGLMRMGNYNTGIRS